MSILREVNEDVEQKFELFLVEEPNESEDVFPNILVRRSLTERTYAIDRF